MLSKKGTTEDHGDCYGLNLIYSGNHYEAVEVSAYGQTRVVTGINPRSFQFHIAPGECFEAPEAVMTYSKKGYNGMSQNMHAFVRECIVRGEWKKKPRPVLLNSWEAAYFDINESKLLKLAKAGKAVGIELFVMDDGWFGTRDDDTQSLGDWYPNKKKLPNGLKGLAKKVNALGLDFGVWVEPEMVNVNSDLYREHPEWVMEIPGKSHSESRTQRILDFANPDLVEYMTEAMTKVFSDGNIAYVKWDMNRIFSDYYSQSLPPERQKEVGHRYMMGLYKMCDTLMNRFPHILFEGCASGGNRFDLGMLCFMPQTWGSDNSDAISRVTIQRGYSYGYPLNTVGSHVSSSPNHQTLRNSTLESRFNIACLGQLGYELNIAELNRKQRKEIKEQIALYKTMRVNLLNNDFYRSDDEGNTSTFSVVSKDKKHAIGVIVSKLNRHGDSDNKIEISSLEEKGLYHVHSKDYKHSISKFGGLVNQVSPIHLNENCKLVKFISKFVNMKEDGLNYNTSGETINQVGVSLPYNFIGTGYNSKTRVSLDQEVRMVFIDKVEE
jgi:alpha-galactosidase